jgi:hypothetical protein
MLVYFPSFQVADTYSLSLRSMTLVLSLTCRRGHTIPEVFHGETMAEPITFIAWTGKDMRRLKSALKVCMAILFEVRALADEQD